VEQPTVRAVFLDVDGTYADHGVVPEAHVQAVRSARRAGHRVLLCTGRPVSMLPDPLLDAGFDGVVASAGAYVRLDGVVLADVRFPTDLAARVVEVLHARDVAFLLETPEAVYGPPGMDDRLAARGTAAPAETVDALRMPDDLGDVSFAKISYFDSPVSLDALRGLLGPDVAVLPSSYTDGGSHAGEIQLARVHKAVGIETVVRHLGLTAADVVAVGDGHNDTEMLAYAGDAVAVEGAPQVLLDSAKLVVPGPAGAGVAVAFERLGLLEGANIPDGSR
jgi:Cof subfamily protein (haloacid dehalogenase superfamily)